MIILNTRSTLRYKNIVVVFTLAVVGLLPGCTKLHETFQGDLTSGQVASDTANTSGLLLGVYNSLENTFTDHLKIFPLNEMTTDAAIAPTRAGDWDDNGSWRFLHEQKWNSSNSHISDGFNYLNGVSFAATDILRYHPTVLQQAQARMIRAFVMYLLLDMFDQVPYREPGESLIEPSAVRKGMDAFNYIIGQIDSVKADLPDGPPYIANKFAADVLLMKCYLNKAVYADRTNANPAFDPADMNKVISLADEIINSNKFSFADNYFDNFSPDNTALGKENIFTLLNDPGVTPGNGMVLAWAMTSHYAQTPGGLNGFTTLSDFYNKFEPTDKRGGMVYRTDGLPPNPGNHFNVGFLVGQQYDLFSGDSIPGLIFTPEVHNIETGPNFAITGIRPIKYGPDFTNIGSPGNDFIFFRLADVLLMKAEAIFRGGTGTNAGAYGNTALSIVNAIRTDPARGASPLSSIDANVLIDERGRELWWEGWRRQDLIRFNKFLIPFQEKDYQSDTKYLLFPIPADQVAANPNLAQNLGY